MLFNNVIEFLDAIKVIRSNIYVAGAGDFGKVIASYFNNNNITWTGFVDLNHGKVLCNKKVFSYDILKKDDYVIISSIVYRQSIIDVLNEFKISNDHIFFMNDQSIVLDLQAAMCDARLKNILKLKNKHYGEKCFVIGNGPSLLLEDLEKIKGEVTFGCNSIHALWPHVAWRPTYYCMIDGTQIKWDKNNLENIADNCKTLFLSFSEILFDLNNIIMLSDKIQPIRVLTRYDDYKNPDIPDFSLTNDFYAGGSVVYIMIQLALYMGFKYIYLLGIDFSYPRERDIKGNITNKNVSAHQKIIQLHEKKMMKKHGGIIDEMDIEFMRLGYQKLKYYADTHNVKIYNATRGGCLEVFERLNLDEVLT